MCDPGQRQPWRKSSSSCRALFSHPGFFLRLFPPPCINGKFNVLFSFWPNREGETTSPSHQIPTLNVGRRQARGAISDARPPPRVEIGRAYRLNPRGKSSGQRSGVFLPSELVLLWDPPTPSPHYSHPEGPPPRPRKRPGRVGMIREHLGGGRDGGGREGGGTESLDP